MGKVVDFVVACTCIIIIILDYIQIIYYYIKKIIQHLDLRYLIWIFDFSTWFFLPTTEFQVHLFLRFESEVWHGTAGLHPTEEGAPGSRTEVSRSSYHLRLYRHHCYNNNRLTLEIHLILYSITVLDFSAVCFFIALQWFLSLMQKIDHSKKCFFYYDPSYLLEKSQLYLNQSRFKWHFNPYLQQKL